MKNLLNPSPRRTVFYLRVLYPIWMVVGMFSLLFVVSAIVVPGDAAATAQNIRDNEMLFKLGVAAGLLTQLIHIAAVSLLYKLLAPANKAVGKLLMVFGLIGVPIAMIAYAPMLGALLVAEGPQYLTTFSAEQLEALALLLLELYQFGLTIASIFWGLWLLPLGYLVKHSGYFFRGLDIALYVGGAGYVLAAFVRIITPEATGLLAILDLMTFGEIVFILGLLFVRVRD